MRIPSVGRRCVFATALFDCHEMYQERGAALSVGPRRSPCIYSRQRGLEYMGWRYSSMPWTICHAECSGSRQITETIARFRLGLSLREDTSWENRAFRHCAPAGCSSFQVLPLPCHSTTTAKNDMLNSNTRAPVSWLACLNLSALPDSQQRLNAYGMRG